MRSNKTKRTQLLAFSAGILSIVFVGLIGWGAIFSSESISFIRAATSTPEVEGPPPLDTKAYDIKMLELAHVATSSPWYDAFLIGTTTASTTEPRPRWPVRATYPNGGALLPFNRIIAYYGNYYSRQMGALGEYDPPEMLQRLKDTAAEWRAADPKTPVIPAIHYIVETAQLAAGTDGDYMARMPDSQVQKSLELAKEINGIVFLDFQVGLSTLQKELPMYEEFLKLPNVHLGIDPEFSMKTGARPGTVVGTFDATDVNFAAEYLARLVRENNLPPKVLIIHRFTQNMLTNYKNIRTLPEVQIVVQMDGWGSKAKKIGTYTHIVAPEPVQFTGFKIFYKNDLKPPSTAIMTPTEVLQLTPAPSYIQYQ